ncbi:MAG: MaoC family dehydratase [Galactobacter sp.]|uniref:MaoC family dehydratase n=1 Tax=Galactobacter sp. TaxID=2676125 RepID=UPI0025B84868|nr:MaoC family dehydratase [Galactobacter sp.]
MTTLSIATLEKGQQLFSTTYSFNRGDLVRYAGASGDLNPIHWNDRFATEVGLPGVIAHGMLTMGTVVQAVTDWAGDPTAIVDYQTRFAAMIPVADPEGSNPSDAEGTEIAVVGTVGKVDPEAGTVRVDLTVTLGDEKVLTKAQALVALGTAGAAA